MKNQPTDSERGAGLLALGILSIFLGPLTGVVGILMSGSFRPFSPTARVGYVLCWVFGVLVPLCTLLIFLILTARGPSPFVYTVF